MRGRRRKLGVLLTCAIISVRSAAGQPPDPADLVAMERRAADKSLSRHEREQAADRAIDDRRELIESSRDDNPKLTGWLIDQAAGLLARLGRDGSDSAALFGIPLAAQRDAAQRAAAEAAADLDRAASLTDQASKALAAQGIATEDPRAAAVEQDRTVRIPFYRARSWAILAALSRGAERTRHAEACYAAVSKLALANPGPEASRRVCLAAALLLRKTPPDAADAQIALDELAWVIRTGAEPDATIPAITRAEAWMGLVHAGVAAGRAEQTLEGVRLAMAQEPFAKDGRPDPLLTILGADAVTRALWERGASQKSDDLMSRAAAAQTALLTRDDLGLRPETLRSLALEKLAIVGAAADPDLVPPPAVRLGRAIVMARDPARRADAAREFRALADVQGAGDLAADALWEWAVLLTQAPQAPAEDRLQAARVLTRLAREYADHPRATDAMTAALAHARAVAAAGGSASYRAAYADALAAATEGYPQLAEIDLWRYERARLLTDQAAPSPQDLATALSLLDDVGAKAEVAADANRLHLRVQVAVLDADFREIADLRRAGRADAVGKLASDRTLPAARRAVDWARSRAPESLARFQLDLADAMVEVGEPEAVGLYKKLLPNEGTLPGGAPRVRLGLARALLQEGDSAGAFTHLREVATRLDAAPPGAEVAVRPEGYWHAWTLMLETLLKQDAAGAKRGSIRAHIKRLESLDPALGGEPWKSRIERVREAVGP